MTIASVVLNSKTYSFASDQAGIITWNEASGGIPSGFSTLTNQLKSPSRDAKDPAYRSDWRLYVPVVAADDSTCACVGDVLRSELLQLVVIFPPGSTTAERTNMALQIRDLAASTVFQNEIINAVRPG